MVVFGAASIAFFLVAFLSTKERVRPPRAQKTTVGQDLKDLFSNKPWVVLLVTTILMILFVATRMSVTAHYFKYYVEDQQVSILGQTFTLGFIELTSVFNGIGQWSAIIGVLCTKRIANAIGKKRALIILFIVAVISTAAFFVLQPEDVIAMMLLQIAGSITGGPLTPLIWAMYADSADYSEWKKGRRATGLVFSASTMSQKFGWAVGAAFAGWLLSLFGFQANIAQSVEVRDGLRSLMSVIPAGVGILAIVTIIFYRLDEKTMEHIETELEARRRESGDSAVSH
jgi:GPH family glycoside/pentoside/hexuronide:cation symporter